MILNLVNPVQFPGADPLCDACFVAPLGAGMPCPPTILVQNRPQGIVQVVRPGGAIPVAPGCRAGNPVAMTGRPDGERFPYGASFSTIGCLNWAYKLS